MLNRPMPKKAKLGILGLIAVIIIAAVLLPMATSKPGPPELVIKGMVKDAQTGELIAGARVFDDGYGPEPNWEQIKADVRSEWGAITNSVGEYSFLTWPEHHSIKVEAPGYKAERQSLYDGHFVFNKKDEEIFDFALEPDEVVKSSEFKKTLPNGVTAELPIAKAEKLEKPDVQGEVWGRVVDGLRAAVEFMPEKESYSLGERVEIRFHIQNVSGHDIQIASTKLRQDHTFVKDREGNNVLVYQTWFSGWPRVVRHILRPGGTIVLESFALGFGDADDPALVRPMTKPYTSNAVRCEPGKYFIHYNVDLPDVHRVSNVDEKDNVPQPSDWQGSLKTGLREVVITPRQEADLERFKLVLNQESMQSAVLRFARKYLVRVCFEQIDFNLNPALRISDNLVTGTFTGSTIPKLLDKLTRSTNGRYTWTLYNRTYVVHPEHSHLMFMVSLNISKTPLEDVVRRILNQGPDSENINIKLIADHPVPETYSKGIVREINVGKHYAMFTLCRAVEGTGKGDIVWSFTQDRGQRQQHLTLHYLPEQSDVQVEGEKPQSLIFHGLDLTAVPHTTNSSKLPDLFEERPLGSKSYHIQKDVTAIYSGLDGTVYFIPRRSIFYVQHDKLGSSTLTYYGPFEGNPVQILNLQPDVQVEVEPVVGEWEDIGEAIPADFNDTISLAEHITLGSIGQNVEGKTFIALLRDREKTKDQQYRFVLVRKNGTVLEPASYNPLLFADKLWERFSFDMPYHHNKIKEFRLQRFPQNLARKASLPVVKPYEPGVNGKIVAQATSAPPGRGALHFDGQNDYLYVPDSRSLSMKAPFTVEMWIKPEFPKKELENRASWGLIGKGCIGKSWILGRGKVEMRGFGITLHRFGDDPNLLIVDYCAANAGRVYNKPYSKSDFDDWMHLYHVFRPDRYTPGYTHPLVIGRFLTSEHPFAGQIGEVRIWAADRSRDQISEYRNKPLTGDEPGLVACWTFEQSGGQIAYDISTNRNHARLGRTTDADDADPTWVTVTDLPTTDSTIDKEPGDETDDQVLARSTIEPIGRHALSFDGVDDYLHVAANSTLTLKPPFTIEMWLKPDYSDIPRTKASEKLWPFLSLLRKGKRLFQEKRIQAGGFMMFVGPPEPLSRPDRNWKCSASLYLGNEKGLMSQVDGFYGDRLQPVQPGWLYVSASCTRETRESYIPVPDQPLITGQNILPVGFPFKGDIAEIRIWAGVSSRDQIARYNNKPLNGDEPGLVACWDFKRSGGQIVYDISPNGNHARLGNSKGPDDADPKWVNLKAASHQPTPKLDVQVEAVDERGNLAERRKLYLPDLETPDAKVVLDFATGQMLSADKMENDRHYFDKSGKGDLVYEYASGQSGLLCLRGARMQIRTADGLSSLKPDVQRSNFVVYFIKKVPCKYQITTAEGSKYELKFLSVDKGDKSGAHVEYWKSDK